MKLIMSVAFGSWLSLSLAAGARAADKAPAPAKAQAAAEPDGKEVTLTGTLGCGKCSFKETKQCGNVLKVKEGGKQVSYEIAKNGVSDDNHEAVCHNAGKKATVKGTVSEEGGKKVLTASDNKFK